MLRDCGLLSTSKGDRRVIYDTKYLKAAVFMTRNQCGQVNVKCLDIPVFSWWVPPVYNEKVSWLLGQDSFWTQVCLVHII